jgi:hypothetical protein
VAELPQGLKNQQPVPMSSEDPALLYATAFLAGLSKHGGVGKKQLWLTRASIRVQLEWGPSSASATPSLGGRCSSP